MRTFVVDNFWNIFNATLNAPLKAFIRCKVEGGYIIEIDGEKFFARSELQIPEGKIVHLKPISYSGGKVIFKLLSRQEMKESPPFSKTPPPDVLPFLTLSNLNLPITQERLKLLQTIIERIVKKPAQEKKSENKPVTEPTLELGIKILNVAHVALKDKKVVFFALHHPVYEHTLIKVKEELKKEGPEDLTKSVSFIVDTFNLGKILVNLFYINGKLSGTLVFEGPDNFKKARKRYEEVKTDFNFSSFIETLSWQWKKSNLLEEFLKEDLTSFNLNRNIDVIL